MAFDERLETRIKQVLERDGTGYETKYMFGGVAFMVRGHMAVGIVKDDLMVRVGPEAHEKALEEPHVRPMDFAGRPMKGMVYVDPAGTRTDAGLARWVGVATGYAATQPVKEKKAPKKASAKAAPAKTATAKTAPAKATAKPAAAKKATAKKASAKKATAKKASAKTTTAKKTAVRARGAR